MERIEIVEKVKGKWHGRLYDPAKKFFYDCYGNYEDVKAAMIEASTKCENKNES